ncbi:cytochrome P450 [Actinomadura madurae]
MLGAFSARGVRSTERTEPEAEPENTGEAEPGLESPETRDDPYPFYARKRRQGPVQPMPGPMGTTAWLITGYDQARAALNDPRFSKHPRFAPQWLRDLGVISEGEGPTGANMLNTDPPDHTRLRRLVSKGFTPRRVEALRPRIQEITDGLLNAIASLGRADLIETFAYPLPITVICELIGVPEADRARFRSWAAAMVLSPLDEERREEHDRGGEGMNGYLAELVERRRRETDASVPPDEQPDLLRALLAHADADEGRLDERELIGTLNLLLVAGHETTANLIGNGTAALLRNPEQLRALRGDPELLAPAIEEMLRYDGPVEQGTLRTAIEDAEIGGVTIPAGSLVTVALGAADRDPARFPEPDHFDISRRDNAHLAFGHGLHFCLGAPLARLEGHIAFRGLLERLPDLALGCPPEQLRQRPGALPLFRGMAELPITFTPVTTT